jgi:hypothetical protein
MRYNKKIWGKENVDRRIKK